MIYRRNRMRKYNIVKLGTGLHVMGQLESWTSSENLISIKAVCL